MSDRYLRASGNWNGPVWAATESGAAGSAATPTINDEVTISANFTVTLTANASAATISHTNGRINWNGQKLTVDANLVSNGSTSRTLDLSNGTLEFTGSGLPELALSGTNLNVNSSGSLIIFNQTWSIGSSTMHFRTASKVFNDVIVNLGGSSNSTTFNILDSPTFNSLRIQSKNSAAHTVTLGNGATLTTNKLVAVGSSSGNRLTIQPAPGSASIAFSSAATSYGQYVNMRVSASGSGTPKYIGSGSVQDSGMGWLLQNPPQISTLLDTFSTDLSQWNVSTTGTGYANVTSGRLAVGWSGGSDSSFNVNSADTYDAVSQSVYFKVDSSAGDIFANLENASMPIEASGTSTYYRFRTVLSGDTLTVYGEKGGLSGWTTLTTTTMPQLNARSSRLTFSGTRNMSSSVTYIDSVGISPEPAADFSGSPLSGNTPLTVNFSDLSNFMPTSWSWNFGDSSGSSAQNPTKTYLAPGTYTVSLTASDGTNTKTVTKTGYITVSPNIYTRAISGMLTFSGGASRSLTAYRSISGTLLFGGGARAVLVRDAEGLQGKRYLYKVYDPDGNYIEVWKDVISELNYTHEINTIGSTTSIELARNSDTLGTTTAPLLTEDGQVVETEAGQPILVTTQSKNQIGSGSSVDYNNRVDIYVFYGSVDPLLTEDGEPIMTEDGEEILAELGAPNGRRIFTGFVSEINSRYGNSETTIVQLTSYGWDLDQFPLTQAGKTTVTFNSTDPSDIARTSIDLFRTDSATYGTYTDRTDSSIDTTGTVVSYTFRSNTYKEVLDKTLELMPSNWYYRIGLGDNTVYYRERRTTPTHLFYLGKHIKALDLRGSIMDSTNRVLFTGGGDPALYLDRTEVPADRTRRTLKVLSDSRVTLQDSAEIIADGEIENSNKLLFRTSIEILSVQYDIESIDVGDTVGFRNFGSYVDELVMQVVGLTYSPDTVQLQLETKPPTISKRLEELRRNLTVTENQNVPDTPTT